MVPVTPRRIIIVDGYGAGAKLLRALVERNVECLHLRSERQPSAERSSLFDPTPYDGDLGFGGDISGAIQLLSDLAPDAVVPGSLRGARYAEMVADGLALPTNCFETYAARREAEAMLTAAREHSAGEAGFLPQVRRSNPQYIVNTVSQGGRHFITDGWRLLLGIRPANGVEGFELLNPALPTSDDVMTYTLRVLENLGILNGAAHIQLRGTQNGPVMIGAAAGLMELPAGERAYRDAGIRSQTEVYAQVLAGSDVERTAIFDAGRYRPTRQMTKLLFRFESTVRIVSVAGLGRLRLLPSFHSHDLPLRPGDLVRSETSWAAPGGAVYLVHDNRRQISADVRQFRVWESRRELYDTVTVSAGDAAS
jgi:hypothetical protein